MILTTLSSIAHVQNSTNFMNYMKSEREAQGS